MRSKFNDQNEYGNKQPDPDNYKWGIFYFNPQDSRVILPKRNPYMGLTLNFANPYSYLILFFTVALCIIAGKYV
jgi:uncharacterized membrane protein